jgi:hypothetical protein
MKQLIEDLISAIEYHVEQTRPIHSTTIALQAARDALKSLPPQRTWVGLTAKEKHEFRYSHMTTADFIEDIEAKLKDKNT